jgi:actin related protein 2/3 complex subunit 3
VTELTIDAAHESYDPLDEIIALFRANTFFRNFEIKGPADRVMIYGILYVSEVLGKIRPNMARRDAEKVRPNPLEKSEDEAGHYIERKRNLMHHVGRQ